MSHPQIQPSSIPMLHINTNLNLPCKLASSTPRPRNAERISTPRPAKLTRGITLRLKSTRLAPHPSLACTFDSGAPTWDHSGRRGLVSSARFHTILALDPGISRANIPNSSIFNSIVITMSPTYAPFQYLVGTNGMLFTSASRSFFRTSINTLVPFL